MSILQQVKNSAYDALPDSRFIKRGIAARQRKAKKLIQNSPGIAKGYLDLAKFYIEQDNLYAALTSYYKGIEYISSYINRNNNKLINTDDNNNTSLRKTNTTWQKWTSQNSHSVAQHQDLDRLKQEKEILLTKVIQKNQQFYYSLPYDVWYIIFEYLGDSFEDLWECARVIKHWHKFISTFPPFWSTLSFIQEESESLPKVSIIDTSYKLKYINIYLEEDFKYLARPAGIARINRILRILNALSFTPEDEYDFKKICFQNISLWHPDDHYHLGIALNSVKNSSIKQVEFIGCEFIERFILDPILKSCSDMARVTYKEHVYNKNRYSTKPGAKEVIVSELTKVPSWKSSFSVTTFLKIYIGYSLNRRYFPPGRNDYNAVLIEDMLAQLPNLVHLFLDARESRITYGVCAATVFQNCPRLKNLILGNNAEMPNTILSDIDESEYNDDSRKIQPSDVSIFIHQQQKKQIQYSSSLSSSITTVCQNLRRFIVLNTFPPGQPKFVERDESFQWSDASSWEHCFSIFNNLSRDSLQILYMPFSTAFAKGLDRWCQNAITAPSLRELHLDGCAIRDSEKLNKDSYLSMFDDNDNNILKNMIPYLPSLEVIFIRQSRGLRRFSFKHREYKYYGSQLLFVDDDVLKQLANCCSRLSHISIIGYPVYTSKGVLTLAEEYNIHSSNLNSRLPLAAAKLPIAYLEMDIPRDIVLQLVKNMPLLKNCHLRTDGIEEWFYNLDVKPTMSPEEAYEVDYILRKRGGSLTVCQ